MSLLFYTFSIYSHSEFFYPLEFKPCPGMKVLKETYKLFKAFKDPYSSFEIKQPHSLNSNVFKRNNQLLKSYI